MLTGFIALSSISNMTFETYRIRQSDAIFGVLVLVMVTLPQFLPVIETLKTCQIVILS